MALWLDFIRTRPNPSQPELETRLHQAHRSPVSWPEKSQSPALGVGTVKLPYKTQGGKASNLHQGSLSKGAAHMRRIWQGRSTLMPVAQVSATKCILG